MLEYTFPGGKYRALSIAATAGNVTTSLTPGTGKRWLLLRGKITLTTDATVATRNILIYPVTSLGTETGVARKGADRAASGTTSLAFSGRIDVSTATLTASASFGISALNEMIDGTDILRVAISNGVAGDSYSGLIMVLEVPG